MWKGGLAHMYPASSIPAGLLLLHALHPHASCSGRLLCRGPPPYASQVTHQPSPWHEHDLAPGTYLPRHHEHTQASGRAPGQQSQVWRSRHRHAIVPLTPPQIPQPPEACGPEHLPRGTCSMLHAPCPMLLAPCPHGPHGPCYVLCAAFTAAHGRGTQTHTSGALDDHPRARPADPLPSHRVDHLARLTRRSTPSAMSLRP